MCTTVCLPGANRYAVYSETAGVNGQVRPFQPAISPAVRESLNQISRWGSRPPLDHRGNNAADCSGIGTSGRILGIAGRVRSNFMAAGAVFRKPLAALRFVVCWGVFSAFENKRRVI